MIACWNDQGASLDTPGLPGRDRNLLRLDECC